MAWPASAALHVIGTLGPALGAIVCWLRDGDRGLTTLWRGCAWRPGLWPWLLVVVAVPCALLIDEMFVVSYGVLFVLGVVCLLLGGTTIFEMPER